MIWVHLMTIERGKSFGDGRVHLGRDCRDGGGNVELVAVRVVVLWRIEDCI